MNKSSICLFAAALLLLVACGPRDDQDTTIPVAETAEPAPSLPVDYRLQNLDELGTAESLEAACEAEIEALRSGITALESFSAEPDAENYLEPLNSVMVNAYNMVLAAGLLAAVHPDKDVRGAGDACNQDMSGVLSDYSLSRPIYDRISRVDTAGLDADSQRFVEKMRQNFRLAGVDRDDATRARIRELNEEITAAGQEFDRNILEAVNVLELESTDQLAGLPQDYIDAHPPGEDGKIRITTQYPDLFPFMSYAEDDELRRQLSVLYSTRAYPDNEAVLQRLLTLRHEFATLLGYDNYAQWVTADKMVGSPQRVEGFLEELAGYTTEPQQREYEMLLARLRQDQPDAERVEPWQRAYLMEKIKSEQFQVDSKEIRQYFNYSATRDGILQLVQDLFQVEFRPWDASAWSEEVEAYELWDGERLVGRFFLDMHPREGKYQHAAVFPIQIGISGEQVPVASLVCNFPVGEGLMQHSQVQTFLHEFGHLIHNLFAGDHAWYEITGINTEWDFVEAPSQMLQEWVWDYDTIAPFAHNADGEPIPRDLLERMEAARDFGLGLGTRRQLSFAALSLGIYNRDPQGLDLKEFSDEIVRHYTPFEPLEQDHFYASFGHLNGYSAIYYTYQWSLAIASDMFTRFEQEGLRNVETAGDYRDAILSQGGSRPAADLVTDFLGREISFKPYAERLSRAGLPATVTE
ncbi:M3 family metallopeptidase [Elongatibacter sediminis]|uniref:M3 family metallopeptidase n=1 Tax=Elongatibacter sediminis TaxID=3119006 RepID=A0AAW9RF80_9GAMM